MNTSTRHIILGIHITDRVKMVANVQEILTEYGCYIKTRLGLHETSPDSCSPTGLLILELLDDETVLRDMQQRLQAIPGIDVQKMIFVH
ncbi:hypothetical protein L0128_14680 [candidate division KSB1 bacterium]|nr:hypothetical protein [candidate division KSB1 bacterium]